MSKDASKTAILKPLLDELNVCSECGHAGGFHVMMKLLAKPRPNNVALTLTCPKCKQIYDPGLVLSTSE